MTFRSNRFQSYCAFSGIPTIVESCVIWINLVGNVSKGSFTALSEAPGIQILSRKIKGFRESILHSDIYTFKFGSAGKLRSFLKPFDTLVGRFCPLKGFWLIARVALDSGILSFSTKSSLSNSSKLGNH